MCCSAWPAIFSDTITGIFEVLVDDRLQHVLFYQNKVGRGLGQLAETSFRSLIEHMQAGMFSPKEIKDRVPSLIHRFRSAPQASWGLYGIDEEAVFAELEWRASGGAPREFKDVKATSSRGNCLIIPLLGKWDSIKLLNTADTANLLKDVKHAVRQPVPRGGMDAVFAGGTWGAAAVPNFVFLQFDIYDIVIAERATGAQAILEQINPEKRPTINDEVFRSIDEWYQCPVAFCCFRSADEGEAKPLAFAFEPLFPQTMVVYTLDAHDGKAPNLDQLVDVNHTVFVGSYLTDKSKCAPIRYTDNIPDHLNPYLLDHCMGVDVAGAFRNGDFVFSTEQVRNGEFKGVRSAPPYGEYANDDRHSFTVRAIYRGAEYEV